LRLLSIEAKIKSRGANAMNCWRLPIPITPPLNLAHIGRTASRDKVGEIAGPSAFSEVDEQGLDGNGKFGWLHNLLSLILYFAYN